MIALSVLIVLLSLIFILIPVIGVYLTLLPGLLALFLRRHHLIVAMASSAVNIINVLFLSPFLRTTAAVGIQEHNEYKWAVIFMGLAFFHAGIAIHAFFRHADFRRKRFEIKSAPQPPV